MAKGSAADKLAAERKAAGLIFYIGRWRTRAECAARVLQGWKGATVRFEGGTLIATLGRAELRLDRFTDSDREECLTLIGRIEAKKDTSKTVPGAKFLELLRAARGT